MFRNLKIAPKLIAFFILVVLLASISGIFGTVMLIRTDKDYSKALVENGFSQGDIGNFNTYLNKGGAVVRDIIMLTDAESIKKSQGELTEIQEKMDEALKAVKVNCQTAQELSYIGAIEQNLPKYRALQDRVVELGLQNKNTEAMELFRNEARPILNEIMGQAQELADHNRTVGSQVSDQLTDNSNRTVLIIVIIIIMAFVISVVAAIAIARSIATPIIKVRDAAAQLEEGDLNIKITSDAKDEVGEMTKSFVKASDMMRRYIADISRGLGEVAAGNFNIRLQEVYQGDFKKIESAIVTIITSLSDTMSQINQAADQVSSGSNQVSASAQALSQGATEQASSVEELAATINEISQQVKQNAENAKSASDRANSVGGEAVESNERMKKMLSAMTDISGSSGEISKIIKTIEDIAFQTNILALNAAVEAARAGVAGKGFAVVADEVRSLASKSAEASKNTAILIEKSLLAVENGTMIADETAKSLITVVEGVKGITAVIEQISQSSGEQAISIAQVTTGTDQISSVVQTNSATAQESAAASEELSGQAQMLKSLVDQFQLLPDTGNIAVEKAARPAARKREAGVLAKNHFARGLFDEKY